MRAVVVVVGEDCRVINFLISVIFCFSNLSMDGTGPVIMKMMDDW